MSRIGVLDSGLGGMILLEHLIQRYPDQDFLFFADQIHSPYGSRSEDELIEIVNRNILWMKNQSVDSILFACNTISCLDESRIDNSIPVQRIVKPTCIQIFDRKVRSVLVCATPFTVKSQVYANTIAQMDQSIQVFSEPLPYLCRDIEELTSDHVIYEKLSADLSKYIGRIDAVLLGCTHYPAVSHLFEQLLGVPVYDSNQIVLEHVSAGSGDVQYVTTANPEYFDYQCERLFHKKIQSVKIEL